MKINLKGIIKRFIAISVLSVLGFVPSAPGMKKQGPPDAYGRVIIQNYSVKAGLAPVQFDHWLHRSRFTCRLCHVDLGFAQEAGETHIKATDNMNGQYCGACHNGKMRVSNRTVFEACSTKTPSSDPRCDRCHSLGKTVKKENDFSAYTKNFPKELFGNEIDWEKAEAAGLIKLTDVLEGYIRRGMLTIPKDFDLKSKGSWMSDIKFSHKKHAVWSGCESCHPDIFNVEKGTTQYTMVQVYDGEYCGVCHGSVAFPLLDCRRCHKKPV